MFVGARCNVPPRFFAKAWSGEKRKRKEKRMKDLDPGLKHSRVTILFAPNPPHNVIPACLKPESSFFVPPPLDAWIPACAGMTAAGHGCLEKVRPPQGYFLKDAWPTSLSITPMA